MRPALPRNNESRGKQKNEGAAQDAEKETDPLLSSGRHLQIRRRSPLTTTTAATPPMRNWDVSQQSDEYHDDRHTHQQLQYTLQSDNTSQFSADGTFTGSSNNQELKRKDGIYKPTPEKSPLKATTRLLEIPEEIYAIRKAALEVLKPLTASWVSNIYVHIHGFVYVICRNIHLTPFCRIIPFSRSWWSRLALLFRSSWACPDGHVSHQTFHIGSSYYPLGFLMSVCCGVTFDRRKRCPNLFPRPMTTGSDRTLQITLIGLNICLCCSDLSNSD